MASSRGHAEGQGQDRYRPIGNIRLKKTAVLTICVVVFSRDRGIFKLGRSDVATCVFVSAMPAIH